VGDIFTVPRFKQTAEILRLMEKKENIRNIGIVAHIDHGKTTMTDSLLVEAGLLSPQIAGKARALDYLEEEQKRGITIKTANISLLHEMGGTPYIVNLIDTPGHVDFTGKVTRALRAIDGAVVVVDAVEEVMVQTETVTRQALEERVKPVLFINKVDRLIKELKLSADEIQNKFIRIISSFNNLIEIYGEPEFKDKWKADPAKETVAFGSALHKWGFTLNIAQQKGMKINEILDAYKEDKSQMLQKMIPLHKAILDMVVRTIPSPAEAQKYRIPKIWKGEINSETGQAMVNCDDSGPTIMCLTMVQKDPNKGLIATGRVFSGSVKEGDEVYLVNADEECTVQEVSIHMGAFREVADKITAGNIATLLGLELVRVDETLIDAVHREGMIPFERIKYVSEPVITIAVEPKNPSDLPRLLEAMNRLSIEDPNLYTNVNKETGEYILSGMGELHLEIAVKFLRNFAGEIEITTSSPIVIYRESIAEKGVIATAKSPNKQNKFSVQVEPLEKKFIELAEKGGRAEGLRNVLALDEHRNMLIDLTEDSQQLREAKDIVISGFRSACRAGPLCGEPLRDVQIKLIEVQLHENSEHVKPLKIMRSIRRAIFGSFLTAKPVLLEPIYKIEISVPIQWIGECLSIIARKSGRILASEQKGTLAMIKAYIPVAETFGLSTEMRSATSGRAFWQSTFDHWEKVSENVAAEIIKQIRERRGLPPEIPSPDKFMDET
jgi:elongation factor 2